MNEAMLSYTIKVIDQAGYDEMFTIRGDDPADYFNKIASLKKWLVANGYKPTCQRRQTSPADQAPQQNVPVCQYHGPMKPSNFGGYYCPKKLHDGTYCQSKADATTPPAPTPQPMPQAQAVSHAVNGTPPPPPAMFDSTPDSYYNEHN